MKKWNVIGYITISLIILNGFALVDRLNAEDTTITLTAKLTIKADKADEFEQVMKKIVPEVRAEKGNLTYTMLRSKADPRVFLFLEEYVDQAAVQAHGKHFGEFDIDMSAYLDGAPVAEYYRKVAQ